MSAITLYEYLAYNVPAECQNILDRYDVPASHNEAELTENLKNFVNVYRNEALEELAEIHPDKDLIAEMASLATPYNGKKESEYLNASGTMNRIESLENQMKFGGSNDSNLTKMDMLMGIGVAALTISLLKS
jgi:hypothetical protein